MVVLGVFASRVVDVAGVDVVVVVVVAEADG